VADHDGLVAWSVYGHLEDLHDDLVALGHDPDVVLPVTFALEPYVIRPSHGGEAFYAPGAHLIGLDVRGMGIRAPSGATAGTIRHEVGHAWFHVLTTGALDAEPIRPDGDHRSVLRSVDEGFADAFALLTLDDLWGKVTHDRAERIAALEEEEVVDEGWLADPPDATAKWADEEGWEAETPDEVLLGLVRGLVVRVATEDPTLGGLLCERAEARFPSSSPCP